MVVDTLEGSDADTSRDQKKYLQTDTDRGKDVSHSKEKEEEEMRQ
jgi:hypothetical protein